MLRCCHTHLKNICFFCLPFFLFVSPDVPLVLVCGRCCLFEDEFGALWAAVVELLLVGVLFAWRRSSTSSSLLLLVGLYDLRECIHVDINRRPF